MTRVSVVVLFSAHNYLHTNIYYCYCLIIYLMYEYTYSRSFILLHTFIRLSTSNNQFLRNGFGSGRL